MSTTGWLAGLLLAAAVLGAQPGEVLEATGVLADVGEDEEGTVTVVLAVGDDQELTFLVGVDTRVSTEGEPLAHADLADALGATATARYRETAAGLRLEALELSWPDVETE